MATLRGEKTMVLRAGEKLGNYEILSAIGAGGMGEVYRARDTKLGREVAIKVLPEELSKDPDRLSRFEREAKLLASLNHPAVATLYGFEEGYLVMELVEGETLAERIGRGPVSVDEALPLFMQIAEGLEAAHEKGIIHRDLKPANIKVTPEGQVKILDFGLAKAFAPPESEVDDSSQSPTLTKGTALGAIMGTAAYMSPEQAKGHAVDKRTDVWAFGCCLYESLTAQRPFPGDNVAETLARVIEREPDWSALPPGIPSGITRLLRRCVRKKRRDRLRDIGDARLELTDTESSTAQLGPDRTVRRRWPWAILTGVALGVGVLLGLWWTTPPSLARIALVLPPEQELTWSEADAVNPIALSPDGRLLVYVAVERGSGTNRLYLRPIDQFVGQPIEGTEGARAPSFSPDGRWIGFFANETLQKVSVSGGFPVKICDTSVIFPSASWGPDDTIVFSHMTLGLYKVSADGGTPELLTVPDAAKAEVRHYAPQILPGGRDVLFTIASDEGFRAAILSLASNEWRTVLDNAESARYVQAGYLVYGQSGALLAVPFDLGGLETRGSPFPLLERVSHRRLGAAHFAVSDTGTLAYPPADAGVSRRTLVWVDRRGQATSIVDQPAPYGSPRVSPDGRQIAVNFDGDIWVYDAELGTGRRLTTDGYNLAPVWNPDGDRITFSAVRADPAAFFDLHSVPADRSTGPELVLAREERQFPSSWTRDGKVLAFFETTQAGEDIGILEGGTANEFLTGPYVDRAPMFSPDGRWLAYVSDETGEEEVYVTRYPGPAGSRVISVNGGSVPVWSRDGRELFYIEGDLLKVVPIESTEPALKTGTPRTLFEVRYPPNRGGAGYDVAPDGQRFVMLQLPEATSSHINVVFNWFEELHRLASSDN